MVADRKAGAAHQSGEVDVDGRVAKGEELIELFPVCDIGLFEDDFARSRSRKAKAGNS